MIFGDKGGRGVGQKGIFDDEGWRGVPGPPKKDDIIYEQPLVDSKKVKKLKSCKVEE